MRTRSLLLLLSSLAACGAPVVPSADEMRAPGWYGVPDEPGATAFATVYFTQEAPRTLRSMNLPAGIELAVQWPGEAPVRFVETFPEPPASARTVSMGCERASGQLLAYQGDELVGVSFKPIDRFPHHQRYANQLLEWSSCTTTGTKHLMPYPLFHEARLPLALCGDTCGVPLIDRTRVASITMSVDGDGHVLFSPSFVMVPKDAAIVFTVNGQPLPAGPGDQLSGTSPWRAGTNTVKAQIGDLPAWEAEVVLPQQRFAPRVTTALKEGADFTVEWQGGDWAPKYFVSIHPREPVLKVAGQSFEAASSPFTGRYEAWQTSAMPPPVVTRVNVRVMVVLPSLTLVEDAEVAASP
ncbi:MAG: hypothetical protein JNK82_20765 [Myxococcaceae bacterium]|nr:hypothetical protein [Myxococcaceae bacterium]